MAFTEPHRRIDPSLAKVSGRTLIRWSMSGIVTSMLLLGLAPLAVDDTYSILIHTISESGGQGVEGAWVQRTGVVVASMSVLGLSAAAEAVWSRHARRWIRVYAVSLIGLVLFPESPWVAVPHNETMALAHTASGVLAVAGFVLGARSVSLDRRRDPGSRAFDWVVIAAMVIIPQMMLLTTYQGLLQRLVVGLGYSWLLIEGRRIARFHRAPGPVL